MTLLLVSVDVKHPVFHAFLLPLRFLDASSHLYMRVCPSVRPSVRRLVGGSVTLSSKTREINIFEQNIVIVGILSPLDAYLQLYETVYRSFGLSGH